MPAAYFVVRATVTDPARRAAFDEWYQKEHLPDATKAFGVTKARRFCVKIKAIAQQKFIGYVKAKIINFYRIY